MEAVGGESCLVNGFDEAFEEVGKEFAVWASEGVQHVDEELIRA